MQGYLNSVLNTLITSLGIDSKILKELYITGTAVHVAWSTVKCCTRSHLSHRARIRGQIDFYRKYGSRDPLDGSISFRIQNRLEIIQWKYTRSAWIIEFLQRSWIRCHRKNRSLAPVSLSTHTGCRWLIWVDFTAWPNVTIIRMTMLLY